MDSLEASLQTEYQLHTEASGLVGEHHAPLRKDNSTLAVRNLRGCIGCVPAPLIMSTMRRSLQTLAVVNTTLMTHSPGDVLLRANFPDCPGFGIGHRWHEDVERGGPGMYVGVGCEEREGGEGREFEHCEEERWAR